MAAEFDLVIRDGLVLDGTGGEAYPADVAIRDGKIAAVGRNLGPGREEISAAGKLVTPGFVDIHTHYDGQITWEHTLAPSSGHGVTTVLMGNCGVGFAPCKPDQRDLLVKVMEGVEDVPEAVMAEGIPWNWETFPEYLDAIEARTADVDFAAQVPHSPVRVYVMGERGATRDTATPDELAQMTEIVREAICAGALGVTTSQSIGHRTVDGDLAPSIGAADAELMALAKGLEQAGQGVFQMIPNGHYGTTPEEEISLLRRVAETSGRPVSFTLIRKKNFADFPERMLALVEAAAADGLSIKAQVAPRPIGMLLGWDTSFHPFRFHPSFKPIAHLKLAEKLEILRRPDFRTQILSEKPEHTNPIYLLFANATAELFPLGDPPDYEPPAEARLGARATREGTTPEALAYDLMMGNDGSAVLLLCSSNYVEETLDPVREMVVHKDTLIGLGDGGAHYGLICDSSFPTFLLTHWTRDRARDRLPLPWAVKALTSDNALAIGLNDRGLIKPGYKADLNIIDYDALRLHAPQVAFDLPTQARRLRQRADGYSATIVSGVVTYRNGAATGALPGRLVRGGQAAPAG